MIDHVREQLYHPSGGVNLDSNGITARPNECIDGLNIDIDTDRVVSRKGTKAFPVPTNIGPVLKFHRYIHPTRGALLFAFCATNIYQYDTIYGWESIYFGASFSVDSWSVTDVVDKEMGSTVVAAGSTYTRPTAGYNDASSRVLLIYDNQNGFTYDGLAPNNGAGVFNYDAGAIDSTDSIEVAFKPFNSTTAGAIICLESGPSNYLEIYINSSTVKCYTKSITYVTSFTIDTTKINVVKVTGTGDVYLNGAYQGNNGGTLSSAGSSYLKLNKTKYGAFTGNFDCYIYSVIYNDITWLAHTTGKYFFNISDGTERIYPQWNCLFPNYDGIYSNDYKWTLNASAPSGYEYYLELSTGGDPGLVQPDELRYAPSGSDEDDYLWNLVTSGGTIDALNNTEWAWGGSGTLGFDTIYYRHDYDVDPNTLGSYVIRLRGEAASNYPEAYGDVVDVDVTGETLDVAFTNLQLTKNLYEDALYTTAINSAAAPNIQTLTLDGDSPVGVERTIVPGTAYLVASTVGVIATASLAVYQRDFGSSPNLESRDVNYWLPVDDNEIGFGKDSYIDLTTGDISVNWLLSTYNGLDLTIYYQYEADVDYKPIHVSNYHNALILANTAEYYYTDDPPTTGNWVYTPWRVRWSTQGNIRLFRENYYQDIALDDITPILGMKSLETAASSTIIGPLYFMKHNSIVRGTYNQNYNLNPDFPVPMFNFEIALSEGIEATGTATNVGGAMFYLGRNDVYAFNGYERISLTQDQGTANTRIQRHLISKLNINYLYRNFGLYDEINRKYYLFVVLKTSSSNYPEDCFVYDIDRRYWVRHTYSQVSAAIDTEVNFEGTIDGLDGSIDGLGLTAIDDLTNNASKSLLFSIGNYTYYATESSRDEIDINDTDITSYFITRDFLGQSLEEKDRVQRVALEARGGTITVAHNTHYDTDPVDFLQSEVLTFGDKYRREFYFPDKVATAIRFMVTLGIGAEFRWLQVFSNQQELIGE